MTKRRRRKPEQIVKLLQEGEAMLVAGKTLGEVLQKLDEVVMVSGTGHSLSSVG